MIFAERVDGEMSFRRGFHIAPHERVLVVEDVVTTGGSAKEVVALVDASGGTAIGIGALIDRADAVRDDDLGAPLKALITLEAKSWTPDECPLCRDGRPLEDPGSRRLSS
jgi:orotate phosphoribosyltransferase